jgi:hypothetical protein
MNTSLTSHEIQLTLCSLSASVLLCSSLEVLAAPATDVDNAWYRQEPSLSSLQFAQTPLDNVLPDPTREPSPSALQASRLADPVLEVGYLGSRLPGSSNELRQGPVLYSIQHSGGATQRIGLIGGRNVVQAQGAAVPGGFNDPRTLSVDNLQGNGLGAFWSLSGAQGWHLDLSASGARVSGLSRDQQGQRQISEGSAVTLSVQGGIAIGLGDNWVIEPQAQLINQRISLDTAHVGADSGSDLSSWSGRVGARLQGRYDISGLPVEPYVRTNLWHTVYSGDTISLDQVDKISSSRNASTVEVGLGLVARVTPAVSLYVSADYSSDVDDNDLNGLIGSLGIRMRW